MSNSKYEYVKDFEIHNELLKNTFIVIRIDGKGFTKFCDLHKFEKPNDKRGIELMILAALSVMESYDEIFLGYGQSDEFSFAFKKDANLYNRRSEKILTNVVSKFSCSYVFYWSKIFPNTPLKTIPTFDGRIILYPSYKNLRDYFCWRQVDCHINNLYNTTFWALIQWGNMTNYDANKKLMKTFSKDKNEILFSQFNINYNFLPDIYKKGTTIFRNNFDFDNMCETVKTKKTKTQKKNKQEAYEKIEINEDLLTDESKINLDYCQFKDLQILEEEKIKTENYNFNSNEKLNNLLYQFNFSDCFIEISKYFKDKNIELTNEDIIRDDFWLRNKFVFKKNDDLNID